MIARALTPIAPMPFTDTQWAELSPLDRRRAGQEWYRRAQPVPLQRGWMPRDTVRARRFRRAEWVRKMTLLGGWQRGHYDVDALTVRLEQARAEAAQLRARTDTGTVLAQAVSVDLEEACTKVLRLSELLLTDPAYAGADTAAIDLREQRQEAS